MAPVGAQDYSQGEVLMKLSPLIPFSAQPSIIRRNLRLSWVRSVNRSIWVVRVPSGQSPEELIATLSAIPIVEYVEPNVLFTASSLDRPSDQYFPAQWNLKPYDLVGRTFGINAVPAWTVSQGKDVRVAVLDTGCAFEDADPFQLAPDLAPDRITPLSDWVNRSTHPNDDNGHGTFMCSVIGSTVDNDIGIAGIAPRCTLMPGKVLDASGTGNADWVASGIYEAANRGAQIILLACTSRLGSRTVQDAIDYADQMNIPVICPAGNDGESLDLYPDLVARFDHTLIVGATNRAGQRATYSNYGSRVALVAPGGETGDGVPAESFVAAQQSLETPFAVNDTSMVDGAGTSIAAAHVAGVLALAFGANRTLMDVLLNARDLGRPGFDSTFGFGLVDAARTVGSSATVPSSGGGTGSGGSGGTGSGGAGTSGGGTAPPPPLYDVAVTGIQLGSADTYVARTVPVVVAARNGGSVAETFTVQLIHDPTNTTLGAQTITLSPGAQGTVSFSWTIPGPMGIQRLRAVAIPATGHTPESNTANNQTTLDVNVMSAPLLMQIQNYAPQSGDQEHGPLTDTYTLGKPIGIHFIVTDAGQPAAGQVVNFIIRGGNGAVVKQESAVTGLDGVATYRLLIYFSVGGVGTYSVQATTTRDVRTAVQTKTWEVVRTPRNPFGN